MDLTNKNALITGASRGIGRAIAEKFAAAVARVASHSHQNQKAAEATREALSGAGHVILQADLAEAVAVQQLVDDAAGQLGGLDILVNNAGVYYHHPIAEIDYATWQAAWQDTLQTNLVGAANASYCAARQMMARGGGRIINVSSRGAFRGEPDAPAYGASKAGMNAMAQSLAKILAPHNILVTTVAPGFVETDMAAGDLAGPQGDDIRQQSPFNRVATPEEVAHVVLFLAAPGSEWVTGAVIDVNGASYLR